MDNKYQTFLFNDEVHSFDEVIQALTHRVYLTHTQAVSMATFIDRKVGLYVGHVTYVVTPFLQGRAAIKCGTEEECKRVRDVINVCDTHPHTHTHTVHPPTHNAHTHTPD